ncbi:MAG: hypothetical protein IJN90_05540 [Bacilli bacterium]|nr:hypothetical protein [Bacilli bacterium]
MKKMSKLFLAFLMVIGLTGCVKYNASMEVKDDKSVTLEFLYQNNGYEGFPESTVENFKWLEEYGYKIEEVKEKTDGESENEDAADLNAPTLKISKSFDNIDDITAKEATKVKFLEIFDKEKKDNLKDLKFFYKDGKKYVADFEFNFLGDATEEERKTESANDEQVTDLSYKIKLPVEVGENNADKVSEDKTELKWNLTYSEINKVNFEFELGGINLIVIIAAVAVAIIIIAVIVLLITKKKKPVQGQPMMNNGQVMNQGVPMNPGVNQMGGVDPNQQGMVNEMMQPNMNQQPVMNEVPSADLNQQPTFVPEAAPVEVNATDTLTPNSMPEISPMSVDQPGIENPLLSVNPVPVENTPIEAPVEAETQSPVLEEAPAANLETEEKNENIV